MNNPSFSSKLLVISSSSIFLSLCIVGYIFYSRHFTARSSKNTIHHNLFYEGSDPKERGDYYSSSFHPQLLVSAINNQSKYFHSLSNLINVYQLQHGSHQLFVENEQMIRKLCQRKYLIARYSCPAQIGNRMHEFLNGFAAALITNRTILWTSSSSTSACDEVFTRHGWISSADQVLRQLNDQGCLSNHNLIRVIVPLSHHSSTSVESILACSNITILQDLIIEVGVLERHELVSFALKKINSSTYSNEEEAIRRAKIIFGEHGGFEFEGYGSLFRTAFSASAKMEKLLDWTERIMHFQTDSNRSNIIITNRGDKNFKNGTSLYRSNEYDSIVALHTRHTIRTDLGHQDKGEDRCLQIILGEDQGLQSQTINEENNNRFGRKIDSFVGNVSETRVTKCLVILATDRHIAFERVKEAITSKFNCDVLHTHHAINVLHSPLYNFTSNIPAKSVNVSSTTNNVNTGNEHGDWGDGVISVADLLLLSRARRFIGSSDGAGVLSTYSMLIVSLMKTSSSFYDTSHLVGEKSLSPSSKILFMPDCTGQSFGSFLHHKSSVHFPVSWKCQ